MPAKILVLDPLTLIGREFLGCTDRLEELVGEFDFRHTDLDEEHQIAEIAAGPALVPPLENSDELDGFDAIVVASDGVSSRHDHLRSFLDDHPETLLVDLSRLKCLDGIAVPSIGASDPMERRLRVAHPTLVAAAKICEVLTHFGRLSGTLAAIDPVSTFGREGVDLLVDQARRRIQGGAVDERILGHILAFNAVAVDPDELQREASLLLPEISLAVTHGLCGNFHGHLGCIGLGFSRSVEPGEISEALSQADGIEITSFPVSLDTVPDNDWVLVTAPVISPDGTQLAITTMADGLRVGGALTAIDILEGAL